MCNILTERNKYFKYYKFANLNREVDSHISIVAGMDQMLKFTLVY